MAEQVIAFRYHRLREHNFYPLTYMDMANSSGGVGGFSKAAVVEKVKGRVQDIAKNAANSVVEKAKGYLARLSLGNVHGFSLSSLGDALQGGTIQGISRELGEAVSVFKREPGDLPGNQNVYGQVPPNNETLPGDQNINGEVLPADETLTPNI